MVIVDSTIWIDYLNGVGSPACVWLDDAMDHQRLGLTDLILCEVLQGIRSERQFREVFRELMKYEVFSPRGIDFAVATARNYRTLRAKGHTIRRTADCLIATFCILDGHTLLHNDHDFDPFEQILGLQTVRT